MKTRTQKTALSMAHPWHVPKHLVNVKDGAGLPHGGRLVAMEVSCAAAQGDTNPESLGTVSLGPLRDKEMSLRDAFPL